MDSIRVSNGSKKIVVNDEGETITLNIGDQRFMIRFFDLMDEFESVKSEVEAKMNSIEENPDDTIQQKLAKRRSLVEVNLAAHERLKEKVDLVLGEDTCRKVFGDIVPSMMLYADLFEALTPFVGQHIKERGEKISQKYNAERTGNS